jgi:uncharacterized protein YcfL
VAHAIVIKCVIPLVIVVLTLLKLVVHLSRAHVEQPISPDVVMVHSLPAMGLEESLPVIVTRHVTLIMIAVKIFSLLVAFKTQLIQLVPVL